MLTSFSKYQFMTDGFRKGLVNPVFSIPNDIPEDVRKWWRLMSTSGQLRITKNIIQLYRILEKISYFFRDLFWVIYCICYYEHSAIRGRNCNISVTQFFTWNIHLPILNNLENYEETINSMLNIDEKYSPLINCYFVFIMSTIFRIF